MTEKRETETGNIEVYNSCIEPEPSYSKQSIKHYENGSKPLCRLCEQKKWIDWPLSVQFLNPNTNKIFKKRHDELESIHSKVCKYNRTLDCKKRDKHQPEPITSAKEAIIL